MNTHQDERSNEPCGSLQQVAVRVVLGARVHKHTDAHTTTCISCGRGSNDRDSTHITISRYRYFIFKYCLVIAMVWLCPQKFTCCRLNPQIHVYGILRYSLQQVIRVAESLRVGYPPWFQLLYEKRKRYPSQCVSWISMWCPLHCYEDPDSGLFSLHIVRNQFVFLINCLWYFIITTENELQQRWRGITKPNKYNIFLLLCIIPWQESLWVNLNMYLTVLPLHYLSTEQPSYFPLYPSYQGQIPCVPHFPSSYCSFYMWLLGLGGEWHVTCDSMPRSEAGLFETRAAAGPVSVHTLCSPRPTCRWILPDKNILHLGVTHSSCEGQMWFPKPAEDF